MHELKSIPKYMIQNTMPFSYIRFIDFHQNFIYMQEKPIRAKTNHRLPRVVNVARPLPKIKYQNVYNLHPPQQNPYQNPEQSDRAYQQEMRKTNAGKIFKKSEILQNHSAIQLSRKRLARDQRSDEEVDSEIEGNYRNNILKNLSDVHSEIGCIKRQIRQRQIRRQVPLKQDNSHQFLSSSCSPPQKPHNQLALSLLGVKRSFMKDRSKSHFKRNSMVDFEIEYDRDQTQLKTSKINPRYEESEQSPKYKNRIRKGSEEIPVYQHSLFPFRADDINYLKNNIEKKVKEKWQIRNTNYTQSRSNYKEDLLPESVGISPESIYGQLKQPRQNYIIVNYKTSFEELKGIINQNRYPKKVSIHIEIPNFFIKPPNQFVRLSSSDEIDTQQLTREAQLVFEKYQIALNNPNVRKYSNCIVVVNGTLCIVWHIRNQNGGKRYFGGWKNKYFDEGVKEGLGLEWMPGKYIYYGQFHENKRNGIGIMKRESKILKGYWKNGQFVNLEINPNMNS